MYIIQKYNQDSERDWSQLESEKSPKCRSTFLSHLFLFCLLSAVQIVRGLRVWFFQRDHNSQKLKACWSFYMNCTQRVLPALLQGAFFSQASTFFSLEVLCNSFRIPLNSVCQDLCDIIYLLRIALTTSVDFISCLACGSEVFSHIEN